MLFERSLPYAGGGPAPDPAVAPGPGPAIALAPAPSCLRPEAGHLAHFAPRRVVPQERPQAGRGRRTARSANGLRD